MMQQDTNFHNIKTRNNMFLNLLKKICQIIYFIIKQLDYQMASLYTRGNYSPYTKGNTQENEQLPLRSKAFTQIDNTIQNYSQSQYNNTSANQDKISEIKKKYEKLLSKSNNKSNQENVVNTIPAHQFGKSVSTFDTHDENSRWNPYNKSYQTPTTNKDRRTNDPNEGGETKNAALRQYVQRQYMNPTKTEVKNQLQCNRVTLNAMKSQLQTKLNDLTAKTSGSSALRNPSNQPRQPQKKEDTNLSSYQAILNKYSKNISQNRTKSTNQNVEKNYSRHKERNPEPSNMQKVETLETKIKDTVLSSYIPKYTSTNKNNVTTVEKSTKEKQLSTISQISNSNHSQNPSYEAQVKDYKEKIYEKYRKNQNNVKQNAQSNIIIQKPITFQSRGQTSNWFKNTASYVDNKSQIQPKKQENPKNTDFTLQKLENSQGFSITRTVTEQNFMNLNKLNQLQARFEQRERSVTAGATNKQPAQLFKKSHNPQINQIKNRQESASIKQSQKIVQQKSEIQKLKEKYSANSTTKYTNPYREKRPESATNNVKDTKYTREISAIKEPKEATTDKQIKAEPRNNQLITKQIEKLDMKIKQIQQNKKDLNMNFRPYQVSKSIPKASAPTQSHQTSISNYQNTEQPQKNYNPSSNNSIPAASANDRNKYNLRYQAYLERVKPLYSEITIPEAEKQQQQQPSFAIKLLPVQYNHEDQAISQRSTSEVCSKSRINQYKNKVELENRTDNGIEQRKKKLQDKVQNNNNTKNLVRMFGQQAVFDEVFRNNKIWFASQRDQKWGELKKQLSALGISLSESQLKGAFTLDESENNPFFSVSDNKCNMKTLAQSFKQAQRHWQEKIVGKFSRAQLEKQGFSSYKIDCDKKGFIEVEDLVRFLNIESGSFLRNRDVSIIFKRMAVNGNKLQFNQFLSIISG